MFAFVFRIIGLFVLALALVLAVLDITRSITASALVMTSLSQTWQSLNETSLAATQTFVEAWTHPFLWNVVLANFIKLPSWLILWLIAMVLMKLGQKRQNPYGRFASR